MKTADHLWTDPSADELVQRHRIHGIHCRQDSPTKRPALCVSHKAAQSGTYQIITKQNSQPGTFFFKVTFAFLICMPRCDWPAPDKTPGWLSASLLAVCHLISYLRCTDPEAELQQQHGRAALPLPVGARIRGVPASEQQGDSAVWQKQRAGAAGNCPDCCRTLTRADTASRSSKATGFHHCVRCRGTIWRPFQVTSPSTRTLTS